MRVLVFGKTGQVARALGEQGRPGTWTVSSLGREECDLARPGAVTAAIKNFKPDLVINAAAYTNVDLAETEQDLARAVNAGAPAEMARAGVKLIHISTDYVFDGAGTRAWTETDACRPLSVYGATKLAGEEAIRAHQPRHIILRTSWVFSPHGKNFVRTMLRLGETKDEVSIVGDQTGGPTAADDIAQTIISIAKQIADGKETWGTYHYAGAPATSWHGFAREIFARAEKLGLRVPKTIHEIATANYPTPARRPLNSRLDCAAIARDWGIAQPFWETGLEKCLKILGGRASS